MKKLLLLALLISGMANAQKGQANTERGGDYGEDWIEVAYFNYNGSAYASARSEDVGAGCYINLPSDPTSFASMHKVSNTLIIETTDMATTTYLLASGTGFAQFSDEINLLYKRNTSGEYRGVPSSDQVISDLNLDQNCLVGDFVGANAPAGTSTETSATPTGTITQNILAGNDIRITDFFGPHSIENEIVNDWDYIRSERLTSLQYNELIRLSGGSESLYVPFPSTDEYSLITYRNTFYGLTTDLLFHVRLSDGALFRISQQNNRLDTNEGLSYAYHNSADHTSLASMYYAISSSTHGRYVSGLNGMLSLNLMFSGETLINRGNNQQYTQWTVRSSFDFLGRTWGFTRSEHIGNYVSKYYFYDGENTLVFDIYSRSSFTELRGTYINNVAVSNGYDLYVYAQENLN